MRLVKEPTLKEPKTISVTLNGKFVDTYILEFVEDDEGNEFGILTVPYVKWLSLEEQVIQYYVNFIGGRVLACIEKQYFDNYLVSIPVKGYPESVQVMDVVMAVIPPEIQEQMLSGTFEVGENDEPEEYKNLPVKV